MPEPGHPVFSLFHTGTPRIRAEVDLDNASCSRHPSQIFEAIGTYSARTTSTTSTCSSHLPRHCPGEPSRDERPTSYIQVRFDTGMVRSGGRVADPRHRGQRVVRYNLLPRSSFRCGSAGVLRAIRSQY